MWQSILSAAMLALLPCSSWSQDDAWPEQRISVLVLTGENNHDWRYTSTKLFQILESSGKFEVEVSIYPEAALYSPYDLERFQVIVLDYNGKRWGEDAEKNFLEAVRGGMGVVVMHASNNAFPGWKDYEELVGHLWREGTGHGSFHPFDVRIDNKDHPLTRGLADLKAHPDELYHKLVNPHGAKHEILATAYSDPSTGGTGEREPMLTATTYGEGRVAHTPLGHVWWDNDPSRSSYRDDQFQRLVIRMTEWAATGEVKPLRRVAPNTLTPADRAAGWKLLFDGKSTNGWRRMGQGLPADRWQVEGGALKLLPGEGDGDIVATEYYEEFEMELEWRVERDSEDSEFHYRTGADGSLVWRTALDLRLAREAGEEVPYDLADAEGVILQPAGEFNHARVVARRDRVEHWLNGIRILELDVSAAEWADMMQAGHLTQNPEFDHLPLGHIALSGQGQDIWFRNIKIRPAPEQARPLQRAPQPIALFAQRDFAGWTRYWRVEGEPAEAFSFSDEGYLIASGLPIGYLRTEADYTDYVLEFDWRYHPTTRQTGEGGVLLCIADVDDIWPYGLEVRFEYPVSGDIWAHFGFPFDPVPLRTNDRQTTRMAEADNLPGEWNRCSIRVERGTVTVHLNDVLVNQIQGVAQVPGKIGIKSSLTEVHYRNLQLTPIE